MYLSYWNASQLRTLSVFLSIYTSDKKYRVQQKFNWETTLPSISEFLIFLSTVKGDLPWNEIFILDSLPHSSSPSMRSLKILSDIISVLFLLPAFLPLPDCRKKYLFFLSCAWCGQTADVKNSRSVYYTMQEAPWCFSNTELHSAQQHRLTS